MTIKIFHYIYFFTFFLLYLRYIRVIYFFSRYFSIFNPCKMKKGKIVENCQIGKYIPSIADVVCPIGVGIGRRKERDIVHVVWGCSEAISRSGNGKAARGDQYPSCRFP